MKVYLILVIIVEVRKEYWKFVVQVDSLLLQNKKEYTVNECCNGFVFFRSINSLTINSFSG